MESFFKDLQVAFRQLARHRGLAAVVVVTLGLAIGVNALTFSFVNFFVFRPLPMKEVSRLVVIYGKHPEHGRDRARSTYADYVEWREQSTSFEDLGAGGERTVNLTGAVAGGALGLLLANWGLAFIRSVTYERVALGANQADVLRLVLRQGASLVLAGLGPGLLLGLGLARTMAGILAGVSPTDAVTFMLVPLLLGTVGLLATVVPAQKAARVRPATLPRAE